MFLFSRFSIALYISINLDIFSFSAKTEIYKADEASIFGKSLKSFSKSFSALARSVRNT